MLAYFTQRKHLTMFIALVVLTVLLPIFDTGQMGRIVWSVGIWGILLSGLAQIHRGAWMRVACVLAVGALISGAADMVLTRNASAGTQIVWIPALFLSCTLAFLVLLTTMMLRDVMTGTRFDSESLFGAVSVYILLGLIFSLVFMLLTLFSNSFVGAEGTLNFSRDPIDFMYLSFVTLTTLGFGDITPQTTAAKVCVTTEAVMGQFYLTILVARLVGLTISQNIAQRQEA